jgi:hypothetical protein
MPRRHEATAASSFAGLGAAPVDVEAVRVVVRGVEVVAAGGDEVPFVGAVDAVELVGVEEVELVGVDEVELVGMGGGELDLFDGVGGAAALSRV